MAFSQLKSTVKPLLKPAQAWLDERALPDAAKAARDRDLSGAERSDPGGEACIAAALNWLATAQRRALNGQGGVARDYSHTTGWATEYPETTGYIVPTILDQAHRRMDSALERRAIKMLDWLVSIQFAEGGFQGGTIGQEPKVPVTFNTGQILLGLAAGAQEYGAAYLPAMRKAANWLVRRTRTAAGAGIARLSQLRTTRPTRRMWLGVCLRPHVSRTNRSGPMRRWRKSIGRWSVKRTMAGCRSAVCRSRSIR